MADLGNTSTFEAHGCVCNIFPGGCATVHDMLPPFNSGACTFALPCHTDRLSIVKLPLVCIYRLLLCFGLDLCTSPRQQFGCRDSLGCLVAEHSMSCRDELLRRYEEACQTAAVLDTTLQKAKLEVLSLQCSLTSNNIEEHGTLIPRVWRSGKSPGDSKNVEFKDFRDPCLHQHRTGFSVRLSDTKCACPVGMSDRSPLQAEISNVGLTAFPERWRCTWCRLE